MQSPYFHNNPFGYFPQFSEQHQQPPAPQHLLKHGNVFPSSPYDALATQPPLRNVDFLLPSPLSSPSPASPTAALAMASNGVLVPVDHLQLYEFILASNVQPSYEMPSAEAQIPVPPTAATAPPKVQFADQPATTFSLYQQPPEEPVYSHQRQQRQAELPLPAPASLAPPAREANARPQCMNCGTTETSAWRKDCGGRTVCNACGLYKKQRGYDRPAAFPFRKSVVRRRMRVKKTSAHGADAVNAL